MSEVTDQIKERLSVAELISEYIKLEKAGSNYKALCPFHNEKSPSFMVNPDRNFWYCFGCQKGGDIFSFVQEMEGLGFREALERLAGRTGVEIPRYTQANKEERSVKERIFQVLKDATAFFENQLKNNQRGIIARQYLEKRGITENFQQLFHLGYAPDGWRSTVDYLVKKGHKIGDIEEAGLLVRKEQVAGGHAEEEKGGQALLYDRFRDRIMFPIVDVAGQVIGYSARVMPGADESQAKYINTTQTAVYDKGNALYGLYQARTEIKKKDFVVIVEGNVDVIASHIIGIGNVVAVSGTALTEQQVRMLKRYTNTFKLCFDMDSAGQNATKRSIQICLKAGVEVEVIQLPRGFKDVGDIVAAKPEAWQKAIDSAKSVLNYFFQDVLERYNPDDVKHKKAIARELLNIIKDIADPIEQSYWLKKLAGLIDVDESVLTGIVEKAKVKKEYNANEQQSGQTYVAKRPRKIVLTERLLGLFSLFPNELGECVRGLDINIFDEQYRNIWEALLAGNQKMYETRLNEYAMAVKFYYDEKEGFLETHSEPVVEWKTAWEELEKIMKKELLVKLAHDIRKAEEAGDEQALQLLMEEFSRLS
jgi:DNA primase